MPLRDDLRSIVALRPGPSRLVPAVQAALAIGIPTIASALAGAPQLGLLASLGAFTAVYGADRPRRERARLLPVIGIALTLCAAIGAFGAGVPVLPVVALVLVTAIAAIAVLATRLGPPGPLFAVLVTGVSGHLASPVAAGGSAIDPVLVVALTAAGAAIAVLVVLAPLAVPRLRRADALREARGFGPWRLDASDRGILFRLLVAVVVASALSVPLGVPRVYWVLAAVVAILQLGHALRLTAVRALHRILGTVLGALLFALIAVAHPQGLVLALGVTALQFGVELLVVRNYGLALVLITPLALSISAHGSLADADAVARERVVDTALGGAVALAVLFGAWLVRRARGAAAVGP